MLKHSIVEGDLYNTTNFGVLKVVKYNKYTDVDVEFVETGYKTKATSQNIKNGMVMDKWKPTVLGVGILDINVDDENRFVHKAWTTMLTRCYCVSYKTKYPTYEYCKASENFKVFSKFLTWFKNQKGGEVKGFVLDKDILIKGNKLYSEDTCCLVPEEINLTFVNKAANRGDHPIGVSFISEGRYRARLNKGKGVGLFHLGYFRTPEAAFQAYKQAKESYIKKVAEKWKESIDPRVYEALMNYQVDITD